jgi:sulfite reductase beta subunit-like hemoprotein
MSKNININIEDIKTKKDGLEVLADLYIYAVLGEKISQEDIQRLKWYGVYPQEDGLFKIKIPLSLGQLDVKQLKALANISKEYCNNSLVLSNRQKIELINVNVQNIPVIFNLLHEVSLDTIFEAGHNVRNVITCPINSSSNPQVAPVSEFVEKLNKAFIGNKNFSNLPNKLQFAISGWAQGCLATDIAEVNFDAFRNDKNKLQFSIKVLKKHLGFISPSQIEATAKAIAKIYREYGNRDDIEKNSFADLVNSLGYMRFFDLLQSMLNFKIKIMPLQVEEEKTRSEPFGITESIQNGKSYIGCKVKEKDIGSKKVEVLASLLEKYDVNKIKVTNKGHLIILDAPTLHADILVKELSNLDFNPYV